MAKKEDQGKTVYQDTRIIGIILLAVAGYYTFNTKRQFYESLVWYGLGIFLLARYDPQKEVSYVRVRRIVMWAGAALAVGAFLYEMAVFLLKMTSASRSAG